MKWALKKLYGGVVFRWHLVDKEKPLTLACGVKFRPVRIVEADSPPELSHEICDMCLEIFNDGLNEDKL